MANINNNKIEPSTAPQPDRWYNLSLGSSFKDDPPSSKFCTLRYEFKPASIDKNQPGTLNKTKDNKVTVEFHSNIPGKPRTVFEGTSSDDYKENDAVLLFDGETFRLERLHRAVKRLKRVWQPGESVSAAAAPAAGVAGGSSGWAGGASESGSPPLEKGSKFQTPNNKNGFLAVPVEVERIEIGDFKASDRKTQNEKTVEQPPPFIPENTSNDSPDKFDDLEEQLDILNDDNDDAAAINEEGGNEVIKEFHTGIDINIPHQNDTDDEIADVDASDDEATARPSFADKLKAQVHAEEKKQETSSSSDSSGSDSSGSGSGSGSGSSSSSDSESSDGDSVNSV